MNTTPTNKRQNSKCDAYQKSDHKITTTKLQYLWKKSTNNKTIKVTSSSEMYTAIYETRYHK